MITVSLASQTETPVSALSSLAARICYTPAIPTDDKQINVAERLFIPGHHTTIEHNHFNFVINGLSVSSVVFGLHLNSPYYNSDQRSGRFSKMYQSHDMDEIGEYLNHFYPTEDTKSALAFIKKGMDIYQQNITPLTTLAADTIRAERPFASDKYIEQNAPKFAQEQLRMFISQVMPTGLMMTLNTAAVVSLWQVAWSPEMIEITDKMRDEVLKKNPDIAYMFNPDKRNNTLWSPAFHMDTPGVADTPTCTLVDADIPTSYLPQMKNSVDILPYSPITMGNNISDIKTRVEISCATMGQDQRHRSIKRGAPTFSGKFYLPPLLKMAGLEPLARDYMTDYAALSHTLSPALMTTIAPYGIMVSYDKRANLNALIHEQGKRLCWCAQEEISEVARQLRAQLADRHPEIADHLSPPCYCGTCHEGVRFCGRQRNKALVSDYFIKRRV